ncbi:modulator of macroautophagy TMEM150B-like [Salvelinus namaycush]|uniref:Modulator of macroautophagy TMEM150B-like n=1 Tax=Salvelinus namaycush TaxID=8040 RepID=A0A8U0U228_SALNM|nr:modulator of macroautophagy TMEM150B-like [Salvelinus namaycush]XP_038836854.1 modulator of macroautophagy TMEM150B-like [Salvelinus namaycush]
MWVVFGIAVSNETVNITARFPYISECDTYEPQSCIFCQLCNICAVLIGLFASEFRHIDCHQLTVQNQGLSETQSMGS